MTKKTLIVLFTLLISSNFSFSAPSLISRFYCLVLGNKNTKQEYKEKAHKALKDLGVEKPEDVPVKQMNGIGPAFARLQLSSFTAFGLWLDEEYLDQCSEEEKIFHIYHEAAHYASRHHQKIITGSAIILPLLTYGFIKLNNSLDPYGTLTKASIITTTSIATLLSSYLYFLPQVVKRQEKEADIKASKTLIRLGKQEAVENIIENLKSMPANDGNIWWYSNQEQIQYLENLIKKK